MATTASVMGSKAGPAIASAQAGQVTVVRGSYDLLQPDMEDTTLQLRIVKLPAQHRIVQIILDSEALDAASAGAIDIGVEDDVQDPADTTDLTLFNGATGVDVQADQALVLTSLEAINLAPVDYDRFIVVTVETASTTGVAAALGITLFSRPELGDQFDGNE